MRKKLFSLTALLLAALLLLAGTASLALAEEPAETEETEEAVFAEWTDGAPALNTLIAYVEAVTDENSPDYIPPADRIAVFDMDGTLMGELFPTYLEYYMLAWRILKDPTIEPDDEMLAVGRTLRDCALDNSFPADMPMQHAVQAARAYAGMTLQDFSDFVTQILVREADGFDGMTYAECFYLPMVEVVEYLQENGFQCYVCSGSDRFICRVFIEGMLDIPYENIIGMDVALEASGQGETDGLDYVFGSLDQVVRTDKLLIKNLKTNKVLQIAQEIGRQPVLSFGNSSGDVSMHNYTIYNNPYKSAAFMLIADDDVRDYGNPEKAQGLREKWEAAGFNVISMANDWRTIYGSNVIKTGVFRWAEELADDRTAVPAETPEVPETPEAITAPETAETPEVPETAETPEVPETPEAITAPETAETPEDVQLVNVRYEIRLGTNDKETGKPVYTREDALEKAEAILLRHFGSYLIQEAHSGKAAGDGTAQRDDLLIISVDGAQPDAVRAAADELMAEFRQSDVQIVTLPAAITLRTAEAE